MLVIDSISAAFGGTLALDRVSLEIPSGAVVGIVGPNGSGKTTLLNVLSGFAKATAGRCLLGGRDISQWPPWLRASGGVGRTFQDPRGRSSLRGSDLLGIARRVRDESPDAANGWLPENISERFGLASIADAPTNTLSWGQLKLLGLACVLVRPPRLLLLDEPATGLDVGFKDRVRSVLTELRSRKETISIVVEHDIEFVTRVADAIVLFEAGRIVGVRLGAVDAPVEIKAVIEQ